MNIQEIWYGLIERCTKSSRLIQIFVKCVILTGSVREDMGLPALLRTSRSLTR